MSLHIGFDISQTGRAKAGCGNYADAMLRALLKMAPEHRYSLYPSFGDFYFDPRTSLRCSHYTAPHLCCFPRHFVRGAAASYWNQRGLEQALGTPDIVHANNFWCPVQLRNSRLIYTLYDLGFMIEPAWTTEENRNGCFNGVFRAAIAADWVVAISRASASDFCSMFPHYPCDRVRVIYPCTKFSDLSRPGVRPRAMEGMEPGRFWLNVGTLEPRKNHLNLVRAYARYLAIGGLPYPLVFSGPRGWNMDGFEQELNSLGIADKVVRLGYVSDDELIWLYRHCFANIYPSLFEGFGLPVLEGMQFGAATLTSNVSSIPEIADEAAVLLDPKDIEAWAQGLLGLALDPGQRERLQERARARAAQFRWERSAGQLLELYQVATKSQKRGIVS
jgi:glycosyltransferase involved in cell wall biosynthesis